MKKVLLVTLFDEFNLGNRLQNYALQRVIEQYGCEVTTLDNGYSNVFSTKIKIKYFIKFLLCCIGFKKYSTDCSNISFSKRKRKVLRRFNQNNLSTIKKITNRSAFKIDWSDYDLAIAGSDQIWHKWRADEDELPYYYLQFMAPDKRFAYAASFGFESFPEVDKEQHRIGLQGMKRISCREESGCRLVEELVGGQTLRVLDPTLLLSAEQWRNLEKQANVKVLRKNNYAFSFFLGTISDEYQEYMHEVMKENRIGRLVSFQDKVIGNCGPSEFLRLIDDAQVVFTDSFHCTVFSVIFEKKFTVFRRKQHGFENMFGRIEDLLSSVNKLEYIYGGTQQIPKCDFDKLYSDSIHYIETILGEV